MNPTKYFRIILLALLLWQQAMPLYGQYKSIFGKNNTYWIGDLHTFPSGHRDSTYTVKDTTINAELFKVIERVVLPSNNYIKFNTKRIYINEDTLIGKIWYCLPNAYTKKILLDFSLKMGDSILTYRYNLPLISTVDSIYYINQLKYIHFKETVNGCANLLFIEGTGLNQSLFYKLNTDIVSCPTICQHKDDQLVYTPPGDTVYKGQCNLPSNTNSIHEKVSPIGLNIYPNPAQDLLYVDLNTPTNQNINLTIFDARGKLIIQKSFKNGSKYSLDVSALSRGLYFIEVLSADKKYSIKFIKE